MNYFQTIKFVGGISADVAVGVVLIAQKAFMRGLLPVYTTLQSTAGRSSNFSCKEYIKWQKIIFNI
jgi:hypothetical protein